LKKALSLFSVYAAGAYAKTVLRIWSQQFCYWNCWLATKLLF